MMNLGIGVTAVILIIGILILGIMFLGFLGVDFTGFLAGGPQASTQATPSAADEDGGLQKAQITGPGTEVPEGTDDGGETEPEEPAQPEGNETEEEEPPAPPSGGNGGSPPPEPCTPTEETCSGWSGCIDGTQTTTCSDGCDTWTETRDCTPEESVSLILDFSADEDITLNVNIDTDEDVFATSFSLYFDPSLLEATDATKGDFLSKDGASTYPIITIDNDAGVIEFANTRFQIPTGVTGTGTLAVIQFHAKTSGSDELSMQNIQLLDTAIQPIPNAYQMLSIEEVA